MLAQVYYIYIRYSSLDFMQSLFLSVATAYEVRLENSASTNIVSTASSIDAQYIIMTYGDSTTGTPFTINSDKYTYNYQPTSGTILLDSMYYVTIRARDEADNEG